MTFLHKLAHRLARLKAAFAIGLVGALACERIAQTTDPSGSVSRLDLSPKSLTLMTNQTTKFTVVALTSTGDTTNVAVSWSVTGGTITDSTSNNGQHYGKYKAPGQTGQYKVRATGGGTSDSSTVTVAPVPVASVVVAPATASVSVGQTTQLTATPLDSTGAPLTGRAVTWASDNAGVATVSGGGLVSGVAAGSANITATIEGKSGTAVVTVSTGSGSSPWMVMDFSQYPNTAALLADVGGNISRARPIRGRSYLTRRWSTGRCRSPCGTISPWWAPCARTTASGPAACASPAGSTPRRSGSKWSPCSAPISRPTPGWGGATAITSSSSSARTRVAATRSSPARMGFPAISARTTPAAFRTPTPSRSRRCGTGNGTSTGCTRRTRAIRACRRMRPGKCGWTA
ncbi:MAG: hypothetical protein DMD65_06850 [Gemmatimonadetes bacterium]|nr:MAG: hypothetical protein DMD65_06850 [Gemmatimonadota bacterium]